MQPIVLQTEITSSLRKKLFLQGTFGLILGALLGIISAFFYHISPFNYFLLGMVITSFCLLAGWRRFQKMIQFDTHPDALIVMENGLAYKKKGEVVFILPFSLITSFTYRKNTKDYGLGVFLKHSVSEKILIKDRSFNLLHFHKMSKRKYQCDLFFLYVPEYEYESLKEICAYLKQNLPFIHEGSLLSTQSFLQNIMHSEDSNYF